VRHRGIVGVALQRVVRGTRPVLRGVLVLSRALETPAASRDGELVGAAR